MTNVGNPNQQQQQQQQAAMMQQQAQQYVQQMQPQQAQPGGQYVNTMSAPQMAIMHPSQQQYNAHPTHQQMYPAAMNTNNSNIQVQQSAGAGAGGGADNVNYNGMYASQGSYAANINNHNPAAVNQSSYGGGGVVSHPVAQQQQQYSTMQQQNVYGQTHAYPPQARNVASNTNANSHTNLANQSHSSSIYGGTQGTAYNTSTTNYGQPQLPHQYVQHPPQQQPPQQGGWQNQMRDEAHRTNMIHRIEQFLPPNTSTPSEASSNNNKNTCEHVEAMLYTQAPTFEDYINYNTLQHRVHTAVNIMQSSNNNNNNGTAISHPHQQVVNNNNNNQQQQVVVGNPLVTSTTNAMSNGTININANNNNGVSSVNGVGGVVGMPPDRSNNSTPASEGPTTDHNNHLLVHNSVNNTNNNSNAAPPPAPRAVERSASSSSQLSHSINMNSIQLGGGYNGTNNGPTNTQPRHIRYQQRLLLLRHAARCKAEPPSSSNANDYPCNYPNCLPTKTLWTHLATCSLPSSTCGYMDGQCTESRKALTHFHKCASNVSGGNNSVRSRAGRQTRGGSNSSNSSTYCVICTPVREAQCQAARGTDVDVTSSSSAVTQNHGAINPAVDVNVNVSADPNVNAAVSSVSVNGAPPPSAESARTAPRRGFRMGARR